MSSERRTAIHMLTACDVSEIKSTQRLEVDAALMSHSGSIDAHFNKGRSSTTPFEFRLTTDSLHLADSMTPKFLKVMLASNLHSYRRLDE